MKIDELFSVEGRVALVSGGSRGIGEMIAAGLVANGATVYISSRKADACEAAVDRITEGYGSGCHALPADLSTLAGIDALAAELGDRERSLDILVNNAGTSWGAPLDEFPEQGWDKVMDTNVKGPFFLVQRLLPMLDAAAQPDAPARIVNIGSIDAIKTSSFDNFSYGPSKAALHAMTRQLAARLVGRHIIVNAIAPGPFPTWMLSTGVGTGGDVEGTDWDEVGRVNPSRRVGTPEDIAGLVLYLSSRAGAYTVGEVITCDGGVVAAGTTLT